MLLPSRLFQGTLTVGVFLIGGYAYSIFGPTILDFQIATSSTWDQISNIIPIFSIGTALGALLAGVWRSFQLMEYDFGLYLSIMTPVWIVIGWSRDIYLLYAAVFLVATVTGMICVEMTTYVFRVWPDKSDSMVQFFHIFFGTGLLLAPLTSKPFLLPEKPANMTIVRPQSLGNSTNYTPNDVHIQYLFGALSLFTLIVAVASVIIGKVFVGASDDVTEEEEVRLQDSHRSQKSKRRIILFSLLAVNLYYSTETVYGSLLVTYLVKGKAQFDKDDAANVTTFFWAVLTFSRTLPAAFPAYANRLVTVFIECLLISAANVALLLYGDNPYVIWAAVGLSSLGMSPQYGQILSYTDKCVKMTKGLMSILYISMSASIFLYPLIVSKLLPYYTDSFAVLCIILPPIAFLSIMLLKLQV